MRNKVLIGLIVFLFGCHSADQRIDDTKNTDSTVKSEKQNLGIKASSSTTSKGEVIKLDEDAFKAKVFDFKKNHEWLFAGDKPVIVDFYADWCGPCKKLSPSIEKLAQKYAGKINVYKVNIDEQQTIAAAFGIQSIPTIMFCSLKGKPMASTGYVEIDELEKYISQILK